MRLRTKFILHFSGLVIVIMTLIAAVVVAQQSRVLKEQARKRVSSIARNVAASSTNSLLAYDMIELDQDAGQIADTEDVLFVWIFDDDGRLLGTNSRTAIDGVVGTLEGGPGVSAADGERSDSIQMQERTGFFGARHALDVACPISYVDEAGVASRIGIVRLGFSLDTIYDEIAAMRLRLALIWVGALSVGVVVSTLMARRVTRPIEVVAHGAQLYAAGNLDHRIEIGAKDEIAALAGNLNEMAFEIRGSIDTIEDLNRNLEQKVRDRTRKLRQTNHHLEDTLGKLRDTQAQLVQTEKMASLGQLVAGVTHEINNPLNYISNGVGPLRETIDDLRNLILRFDDVESIAESDRVEIQSFKDEIGYDIVVDSIDELIEVISDGARRASTIVNDLRTFSRHDEAELKRADIHDGIEKTLALMQSELPKEIELVRDFATIEPFEFRPAQLNQVFLNLLTNAAYAIDGAGRITIRTRLEEGSVTIAVEDDGCGIPPENLERVFEPFFTTKDVGAGTGLGLAISYGIVELHGGTIEVSSRVGEGSTFTIRIPTSDAHDELRSVIAENSDLDEESEI